MTLKKDRFRFALALMLGSLLLSVGCDDDPDPPALNDVEDATGDATSDAVTDTSTSPDTEDAADTADTSDTTNPDPGSLVAVTVESTVGVLLDDFPAAMHSRIAADIVAKPTAWWEERVRLQLRLTSLRLVYRDVFYDPEENKKALTLPPEAVWEIAFDPAGPALTTINGHTLVAVSYTMTSTLLSDVDSPGISEPALADIGGVWDEPFILPIDPTLLLQRTGYACVDEDQFPPESVVAENAYQFYDDTCTVEAPGEQVCHLTFPLPDEDCPVAVDRVIGSVEVDLHYERVAWDQALADKVRTGEVTTEDFPDLKVLTTGVQSLSNNWIMYKYFTPDHCGFAEGCVTGSGWRRLLTFDSIDHNVGGKPIHIGEVDYNVEGFGSELVDHGVYEISECHNHYHLEYYGNFSFSAQGAATLNKNGFCLESTGRLSNHELAPLHSPYNCHFQGVSPGWVDLYAGGLVCNWVDITSVATGAGPVTGDLQFHSNPDGFLCEGSLVVDDAGEQLWEPTEFKTDSGATVDRPMCEQAPNTEANDIGTIPVTVPSEGGRMSSPCASTHEIGPKRDCDFSQAEVQTCTPGETVTLRCSGADADHPQVARFCETSQVLGRGIDCGFHDALASVVVEGAEATASFTCPAARDAQEPGGQYALYTAPVWKDDGPMTITCVP